MSAASPTVARVLDKLQRVKALGEGWEARCPAHEDQKASLTIGGGRDGRVLLKCHAGCEADAIVEALGLTMADLFERRNGHSEKGRIVAEYSYDDETGTVLKQAVRFDDPKGFAQRRPDGHGGWIWKLDDPETGMKTRRVVYRLAALHKKRPQSVVFVEGEKDVAAVEALGFSAATNIGGAGEGKWRRDYTDQLIACGVKGIAIIPDHDRPGHAHATAVAASCHAADIKVKVLSLPGLHEGEPPAKHGRDVSDWLANGGTKEQLKAIASATPAWKPSTPATTPTVDAPDARADSIDEVLDHCRLTPAALQNAGADDVEGRLRDLASALQGADALRRALIATTVKKTLRETLKIPSAVVAAALGMVDPAEAAGDDTLIPDDAPWSESVDGAALLDALATRIRAYVILPNEAIDTIALWLLHAWALSAFRISPYLLLTSPTKRCGKTRALEIIGALAPRAIEVSNITAAALFRAIEKWTPTLLLDEFDTYRDNDDLRGVLNGGHLRATAKVIRCVGEDQEPTIFSTWCPKVLAGIGKPADTLVDRSWVIALQRKRAGDRVASVRADALRDQCRDLRRQAARWATDHETILRSLDPPVPATLHDRAADNARPLLAVASQAGGHWLHRAQVALTTLVGVEPEDEPLGVQLLTDLRGLLSEEKVTIDAGGRVSSSGLCEALVALDTRPWATCRREKPIDGNHLARLLRGFGIRPEPFKSDGKTIRGYAIDAFADAFVRYLPLLGAPARNPATEPENIDAIAISTRNREGEPVAGPIAENINKNGHGCGVAGEKGGPNSATTFGDPAGDSSVDDQRVSVRAERERVAL